MVGDERSGRRSDTGKALGLVGLGAVVAVAVLVTGAQALISGSPGPSVAAGARPAATSAPRASSAPVTDGAEESDPYGDGYDGYGYGDGGHGADAEVERFFAWASTYRVGSLDLGALDPAGPLPELAKGYCLRLSDQPGGSGDDVTRLIRSQTGGSLRASRDLLEHVVPAFCPQKARHLV